MTEQSVGMAATHYQVLGVAPSCSADELRRAYHREARRLHPDKSVGPADELFLRAQAAYEALRDGERRAAYDKALAVAAARQARQQDGVVVSDEVAVSDMQREELEEQDGEALVVFSHPCRCGGVFEVAEDELADGVRVVPCAGCSQHIRVLYTPSP